MCYEEEYERFKEVSIELGVILNWLLITYIERDLIYLEGQSDFHEELIQYLETGGENIEAGFHRKGFKCLKFGLRLITKKRAAVFQYNQDLLIAILRVRELEGEFYSIWNDHGEKYYSKGMAL